MINATVFADADVLSWRWPALAAGPSHGWFGHSITAEHEEDPP